MIYHRDGSANDTGGAAAPTLRCASWNIHRARGTDGRIDPGRIRAAIADHLAPDGLDVLALQEADEECRPHGRILDIDRISADIGLGYQHADATMRWGPQSSGFLGTILFMHPRFDAVHRDVIDLPGHCHRGAVAIEAQAGGVAFRLMSAHLSLSQPLRIIQMRIIGQYLRRRPPMQTVLLGDFNEWRPWGGLMFSARLVGQRFRGPAIGTFPSRYPVLPVDRIMTDRPGAVFGARVMAGAELRRASDHLPIAGTVSVA
jgi:endonuclease/exonuclease/phosphatase family metal-dependent hydrolase